MRNLTSKQEIELARRCKEDPVFFATHVLGLELWDKQKEILRSLKAHSNTCIASGHGTGKAILVEELLPTPSGWVEMGDIKAGDNLYDEEGNITTVNWVSRVQVREAFRVTFDDKSSLIAHDEHEWNIHDFITRRHLRKQGVRDYRECWDATKTVTTEWIADNLKHRGQNNVSIPVCKPLSGKGMLSWAYTLGVWLGDGSRHEGAVTLSDKDALPILRRIVDEGFNYRARPSTVAREAKCASYHIIGLRDLLKKHDLLFNKHIPVKILRSNFSTRLALLQGLMDTDGFQNDDCGAQIDLCHARLHEDATSLVASLGTKAFQSYKIARCNGKEIPVYRLSFTPDFQPFSLKRKKIHRSLKQATRRTCRIVRSVTPIGKQKMKCLGVDSPNKLFLAGRHHIPTHNSYVMGVAIIWFLYVHRDSIVITTAPTARQVDNILWAGVRDLHVKSKLPLGGKVLRTSISLDEKWFALGFSTDDPDKFQGYHAEDILVVFDEACGIEPCIYEAANGILTSVGAKWALIGNPTDPSGPFADKFKDPNWHKIYISCYESPGVKDPIKWPKLTTQKWIDERKTEWGEASPLFISRVLGQFPEEGEDTLIPLGWCIKATRNDKVKAKSNQTWMGVDVARYGDDKTVITTYSNGKVIGRQRTLSKKDLMEVVGYCIREARAAGPGLMCITIDDTGLGGGVTSRLKELGYPTNPLGFARSPKDRRMFKGIRDEAFWEMRELFRAGEISIPDDGELVSQLSAIKYRVDSKSRIEIETKDQMKKRGLKSPNKADSLMIAVYGSKRMFSSKRYAGRVHEMAEDTKWY